ncbi:LacI family DNA-binding transcriptional regulator [Arthrobacter sp. ATA002]|uniref:LacI family DNA-binding transcriptional regulator n=1 Tax=Arthrobacter sp. ATA002 TaxID=2991715 RepID=UPI0022A67A98|nr:LacI family DNA-binding transcriptional regulator [Arthrobacter sp. ATA002]WAP52989.1 LacI family DNA-binding transcriptional regulator [Arthrobacter sp. ATA002]
MPTMSEVARAAGVSTSTVSYVLSGKRSISEETRRQVQEAVSRLGYSPHAGARSLASNRSNVLGLMAPLRADVNVSVVMQFVAAVVSAAREFDQDVLLLTQDDAEGIERVTSRSMVDGLIMMDIEAADPRIPRLAKLRKPAVLIGLPDDAQGLSCVDFDFASASKIAVRHLADLGHQSVAFIGSPPASLARHATYADRAASGFEQACRDAGLGCSLHASGATSADLGEVLDHIFRSGRGDSAVTGLVVHNEALVPMLREALAGIGLSVPDDVSVVAVAPVDVATASARPWTAVSIPAREIGRAAVEMVMDRLNSDKPVELRLILPALDVRTTTAAPPHR